MKRIEGGATLMHTSARISITPRELNVKHAVRVGICG